MEQQTPYGLFIYNKDKKDQNVLKDLLQLVRTHHVRKFVTFAYVEAHTSLIPHLSLWENLQIVIGGETWKDTCKSIDAEWMPLINLIKNPHLSTEKAAAWEKFIISLVKGLVTPSKTLLIDFNEDLMSPLMIQNFKKVFLKACEQKTIYLATASTSLWLDCAYCLVTRNNFEFEMEMFDAASIKRHWAA